MKKRLKEIRSRRFTQEEIAQLIGINNIHVSNFENDKHDFSLRSSLRYAKYIGYSIDPTGLIEEAFLPMLHVPTQNVIRLAQVLNILFDPEKLFAEEVKKDAEQ